MAVVQSFGALQAVTGPPPWGFDAPGSIAMHGSRTQTYAAIYASQPAVRTCVDFLSRNIAELAGSFHAYRRVSDTDRERLHGHEMETWLGSPNPTTSQYRLFESLTADLAIYFNAYWLKVPWTDPITNVLHFGLVRLPPDQCRVEGGLLPKTVIWTRNHRDVEYDLSQIVRFDGYNPLSPFGGLSPLETLRRTLAEESASSEHREAYWRHASRMEGVIERPATAAKWTPAQKGEWRRQWQERFSGAAGAGQVAVLEDGMTFRATSFSPKDSEFVEARKLALEETARAFHIPAPMVGILDHATFSNIKEQHKHLYQDCLGPWLRLLKEEIERQLLTECVDQRAVYYDFNLAAKLAGSFEEQATSLQVAVGRPWMTANEARARVNLPAHDDPRADDLAEQQGGPAIPSAPSARAPIEALVRAAWDRQHVRLARVPPGDRAALFDRDRYTRELAEDLSPLLGTRAVDVAARINDDTYTLLLEGADAFAPTREVRNV